MLMEWLKPVIDCKANEMFDSYCQSDRDNLHQHFLIMLDRVRRHDVAETPEDILYELENIFILRTRYAVEFSYRSGVSDGIKLIK